MLEKFQQRREDEIIDSLFDLIDPPKKSTDWKWTFADYPEEKNGLKVFSCFAWVEAARWDTSLPDVKS